MPSTTLPVQPDVVMSSEGSDDRKRLPISSFKDISPVADGQVSMVRRRVRIDGNSSGGTIYEDLIYPILGTFWSKCELPVSEDDLPRFAEIRLRARQDDPVEQAKYPDDPKLPAEAKLKAVSARIRWQYSNSTFIYMKAVKDQETCGYVVWGDPNNIVQHPLERTINREEYLAGGDQELLKALNKADEMLESEVKEKHWTLGGIAVDPKYQNMGIGGVLLDWGLRQADEKDLAVCCIASEEVGAPIIRFK